MRHGRYQRDGGSAATNHHDPLPRVVERFRPVLGMKHLPLKIFNACELWDIT